MSAGRSSSPSPSPRRTIATLVAGAVALVGAATAASAHDDPHHVSTSQAEFEACAPSIPGMRVDMHVPEFDGAAWFNVKTAPDPYASGCTSFSWMGVSRSEKIGVVPLWAGRQMSSTRTDSQNSWDCSHSSISYGVYIEDGSWRLVGYGVKWGGYDAATKSCNYSVKNLGGGAGFGQDAYGTSTTAPTRYRIAVKSWSHNSTSLAHSGTDCANAESCYWPTKVFVSRSGPHFHGPNSAGGAIKGAPAVATTGADRLDVFGVGNDNAIWSRSWTGSTWSTWASIGGNVKFSPAAVGRSGGIDLVAVNADGTMVHRRRSSSTGAWGSWTNLGGGFINGAAIASAASNRLDVFGIGADRAVWHRSWKDNVWSSGWVKVGGLTNHEPAAIGRGGNVDLFVTGDDGAIWQNVLSSTGWTGFHSVGGSGLTSGPAASTFDAGRVDLFARGANNNYFHVAWDNAYNAWSPWRNLGGGWTSRPAAVSWAPGRIDVVGRGGDGAVWQLYHTR